MLSRESEYGLEGLIVLARTPQGKSVHLLQIAEARQLPPGFLARIFQKLRRHDLVSSHRGAIRGYTLARPPQEITLRQIVEAIEGPALFERCVFWPRRCNARDCCRLHDEWTAVTARLKNVMEQTTLQQLAERDPRPL